MVEEQFNRLKDAPWFNLQERETVLVGGAGGIGSWLTLLLCRAGFNPILVDDDTVEVHNLGGQLFKTDDIGKTKIQAVANTVMEYSGDTINTLNTRISPDGINCKYSFGAFDNMEARKAMFESWKRLIPESTVTPILIDGRLEAEQLQIFCVTPATMEEYEREYLFNDSEAEEAMCTMKQTSHSAAMIASHMVAFFTNHIVNINAGEVIRSIPFYYEYFIPNNLTEEIW